MTEQVKDEEIIRFLPILVLMGIAGITLDIMGYLMIDANKGFSIKTFFGMMNIGIGTYILLMIINPFLNAGLKKLFGKREP
ncbi:MAG: hypothetical protein M0Q91_13780 [Methanoregula sp.]|jgi:hypothetical protein|nr:hypothetical protein [Methanoregula sp.]